MSNFTEPSAVAMKRRRWMWLMLPALLLLPVAVLYTQRWVLQARAQAWISAQAQKLLQKELGVQVTQLDLRFRTWGWWNGDLGSLRVGFAHSLGRADLSTDIKFSHDLSDPRLWIFHLNPVGKIKTPWVELDLGDMGIVATVSWSDFEPALQKVDFTWNGTHSVQLQTPALSGHVGGWKLKGQWKEDQVSIDGFFTGLEADSFFQDEKASLKANQIHFDMAGSLDLLNWRINLEGAETQTQEGKNLVQAPLLQAKGVFRHSKDLVPSSWSPEQLALRWGPFEALWGENYFSFPGSPQWVHLEILGKFPNVAGLSIRNSDRRLPLHVTLRKSAVEWNVGPLNVADLFPWVNDWSQKKLGKVITFEGGSVESQGKVRLDDQGKIREFKGSVEVSNLDGQLPGVYAAFRGLSLKVPFELGKVTRAELGVNQAKWRALAVQVPTTVLSLLLKKNSRGPFPGVVLESESELDWRLLGVPVQWKGLSANFEEGWNKQERRLKWTGRVRTGLRLPEVPLAQVLAPLCIEVPLGLPVQVSANLDTIEMESDAFLLDGKVEARLFSGKIELEDLEAYDLFSAVPEVDFNMRWAGIELKELGNWIGFGEMDGTLEGHFEDVTFQSWLPTEYRLLARVKPLHHSDVVFSPDAMRNFVKLFTGDSVEDALPGIAKWFAFGWPSRFFGGYDIDYAGVQVKTEGPTIILETLDTEKVLKSEGKRYILYGQRFKVPVRSSTYPVLLDGPAMANFVRHVLRQVEGIAEAKKGKEEKLDEKTSQKPSGNQKLPAACSTLSP